MDTSGQFSALRQQRGRIAAGGALMALSAAAGIAPIMLVMRVAVEAAAPAPNLGAVCFLLGMVFLSLAAQALLYACSTVISHNGAFRALAEIRLLIVGHLKRLPLGWFQKMSTGELSKIVNYDVEAIELYLAHALPELFATIIVPALILAAVLAIDWRLGLAMISLLPLVAAGLALLAGPWFQMTAAYSRALASMSATLTEFIATMPVIKAFSREEERSAMLSRRMAEYDKWVVRQSIAYAVPTGLLGILVEGGLAVLVITGSILLMHGRTSLDAFLIALFLGIGFYAGLAKLFFIESAGALYKNSLQNIDSILSAAPPPLPTPAGRPDGCGILFDSVSFGYEAGLEVLRGISAAIPERSLTAIVGKSGAGKSTLASLIMRFWIPRQGKITIGGLDLRMFEDEELARLISMVRQEVFLFNASVAENIRLGRRGATGREVREAAAAARIHDFIMTLPEGYATTVGEGGARLSGGERQRLAIARCILKDAPIVILDEATAAVDPYNERLIHEAIHNLTRGKTLIVIAHHLNTVVNADQILLLDGGRLAASGTHRELLEDSELYRRMWCDQEAIDRWGLKEGDRGCS